MAPRIITKAKAILPSAKEAALQTYFEWLPIRPWRRRNHEEIYRSFSYGNLVDLHMLDTRVLARDKQLDYADYGSHNGFVYVTS